MKPHHRINLPKTRTCPRNGGQIAEKESNRKCGFRIAIATYTHTHTHIFPDSGFAREKTTTRRLLTDRKNNFFDTAIKNGAGAVCFRTAGAGVPKGSGGGGRTRLPIFRRFSLSLRSFALLFFHFFPCCERKQLAITPRHGRRGHRQPCAVRIFDRTASGDGGVFRRGTAVFFFYWLHNLLIGGIIRRARNLSGGTDQMEFPARKIERPKAHSPSRIFRILETLLTDFN